VNELCVETPDAEVAMRFPGEFPTDERAFFNFCQANRDLRIERDSKGNVVVTPPVGTETSGRNAALTAQLYWIHIYRPAGIQEIANRPSRLSAEPEMPGLIFDLTEVW
jgi:Uma2 family endonuclease